MARVRDRSGQQPKQKGKYPRGEGGGQWRTESTGKRHVRGV